MSNHHVDRKLLTLNGVIYRLFAKIVVPLRCESYLFTDRNPVLQEHGQGQRTVSPKTIFALIVLLLVNQGRFACFVSHHCVLSLT